MKPEISVVIPTYNGAHRLYIPLTALGQQTAPAGSFEILIVDNNSTDRTAVAVATQRSVCRIETQGIQCRVISEPRPGATYARIRGAQEAAGRLICFLDDDNAPDPDYVERALEWLRDESIGLLVSRIYPAYEVDPPASIAKRQHLLAINYMLGESVIDWGAKATMAPTVTAGMWVRRDAFLAAIDGEGVDKLLADRRGKSLACGGDIEIGYLMGKAGYRRVYAPNVKLRHHIPRSRFRFIYFCRLITGIVRSEETLVRKYQAGTFGLRWRMNAVGRFVAALCASPVLLLRRDGIRETLFALTSRWAKLQGPHPID